MKKIVRAAAALALAIGAILGASLPAMADPTPTPAPTLENFVDYSGNGALTSTDGGQTQSVSYPVHARIDCDTSGCILTAFTIQESAADGGTVFDLTGGQQIPIVDGKATQQLPANGDPCADSYIGAGTLTIVADSHGIDATRSTTANFDQHCPDGSDIEYAAGTLSTHAALDGGRPCILDGSCPTPTPTPAAVRGSVATHRANPVPFIEPSTLNSLPTVTTALTTHSIIWAAGVTVVLVLLIAFPTHLFNTATEFGADRVREWWARRRPRRTESLPATKEVNYRGWPLAVVGILSASLISSFIEPTFGLNVGSIGVFLSIFGSFALDVVGGWLLLIYLVRRASPHTTARFRFAPTSLFVVVAAVIFTRLTGFSPGMIFGLVAGVAFGTALAAAERARVALVGLGYSFIVGVIGWVGYSLLTPVVGTAPTGGALFVQELLSAIAIGGIAALPIALVPLRGLTGYDIFSWNRWVWGGAYAIGLLGFFVVLMPLPFSWTGVHINLIVWIVLYVAYGVASVVAWLVFAKPWKKPDEPLSAQSPESA